MNTTQRPNFALVCIAVVLLIFSFAGEMLCNSALEATTQERSSDTRLAVQQPVKTRDYPAVLTSQVFSVASFTQNDQATAADQPVPTVALAAGITEDNQWVVIDSIQELNNEAVEAVEASSRTEPVRNNHQVTYNLNFVAKNDFGDTVKSTKPATSKSRPSISKMAANKSKVVAIAVSANPSIYSMLLPRYFSKQARLKLKMAVEQVNLGDKAKDELKLALLEGGKQDLIELKQVGTDSPATESLMNALRKLAGYSTEEKIYVLKNLSEKKIRMLRKILNAHNIKLRAFIMS